MKAKHWPVVTTALSAVLSSCSAQSPGQGHSWWQEMEDESAYRVENYWNGIPSVYHDRTRAFVDRLLAIANGFSQECCVLYGRDPNPVLEALIMSLVANEGDVLIGLNDLAETDAASWTWNETAALECERWLIDTLSDCVLPTEYRDHQRIFSWDHAETCRDVIQLVPDDGLLDCHACSDTCRRNGYPDHICIEHSCFPVAVGLEGAECRDFTSTSAYTPLVSTWGVCAEGLDCQRVDEYTCSPPQVAGGFCERASSYFPGTLCTAGTTCIDNACTPLPVEGEPCPIDLVGQRCGDGSTCFCDKDDICACSQNGVFPGEACSDGQPCMWGFCEGGVCRPDDTLWCMPMYLKDLEPYREGVKPRLF
jgi:hypothetical protein